MATEQKTTTWNIDYIDSGYCRIVYSTESGGRLCFQDEEDQVHLEEQTVWTF